MTDQYLVEFIRRLPLTDVPQALKSLIQYDRQMIEFDLFIIELCSVVDFTKISPLKLILDMTHLSNTTPSVQRFVNDSCNYLAILIQSPDIFYENYNYNLLLNDFVKYIYSIRSESQFIHNIIHNSITNDPSTAPFFLDTLKQFYDEFKKDKLSRCLDHLQIFHTLFSVQNLRLSFFQSRMCTEILTGLFSKSIFPNSDNFSEYFNDGHQLDHASIEKLNSVLSSYYTTLLDIIILSLRSNTAPQALSFIRNFEKNVKDAVIFNFERNRRMEMMLHGFMSPPDDKEKIYYDLMYEQAAYFMNFESVLLLVAFKSQNKWHQIDAYTPYKLDSLTPLLQDHPLSVVGEYSWHDLNATSLSDLNRAYEDKDEDIRADKEAWLNRQKELMNEKIDRPTSDFFFAAHKAIKLSSDSLHQELTESGNRLRSMKSPVAQEYIKINREIIPIILCVECRRTKLINFLIETLRFMARTAQYNTMTKEVPKRPPIAYQHLPEYMLNSCVHLLTDYYYFRAINKEQLEQVIDLFSIIFMNKKYVRNPNTANVIVNFLAHVSQQPMNSEISFLLVKDTIIKQVYPQIVDFFSRVERTGTHSGYYDKIMMRQPCLQLMTFWFQHRICRQYYLHEYQTKPNVQFLYYLLGELAFFTQLCIDNITNIKTNEFVLTLKPMTEEEIAQIKANKKDDEWTDENYKNKTEEEKREHYIQGMRLSRKSDKELHQIIDDERKSLQSNFQYVQEIFNLVNTILSFIPSAFNEKQIAEQVVTMVSAVLSKVLTTDLSISNPHELKYDQNYFIGSYARFISMMTGNKNIIDLSMQPERNLGNDLCEKVLDFLNSLNEKTGHYNYECNGLKRFIELRKQMDLLVLDPNVEIPDELCDPITYELLTDPILLPTGTVLNRTTLIRTTGTQIIDPVQSKPFNMDEVKEAVDIKKKAQEFFNQHAIPAKK